LARRQQEAKPRIKSGVTNFPSKQKLLAISIEGTVG